MGFIDCCLVLALRVFRYVVAAAIEFVCHFTHGKPDELPPLTNKILLQPATTLAAKIRRKEVTSVELVEAMIARVRDVQPYINAVVDTDFQMALEEAKRVDTMIALGSKSEDELKATPYLGVPFSCKEYIAMEGMYFSNGLYSRKGVRATFDADVVRRMKAAGAIPIVKTNVPELSISWSDCENYVYGATRNPYDTRRMPGGSTGGEAALISAGGSLIGLGSDLGGSLRIPAFENGIFAHKPTAGIVPDIGTYPPFPPNIANFYSNLGPLCRYASDLRPMMKILAGDKINLDKEVNFRNLKIFYMEDSDHPLATPVVPEIKEALQEALYYFENKYQVTPVRVKFEELRDAFIMWFHILDDAGIPSKEALLSDGKANINLIWEIFKWCFGASYHTFPALALALGQKYLPDKDSETRKKMRAKLESLREKFNDILQENCIFLYPTQPRVAPFLHTTVPVAFDVGYTCVFNILGFPATHAPLRLCKGLPIGIQVVGNMNQDGLTITVAEELERAFGGWTCPSPIL